MVTLGYGNCTIEGHGTRPGLCPGLTLHRRLGMGPGFVLAWKLDGDKIVVRRVGRFTSEDVHRELFGTQTREARNVDEMKEGIRQYAQKRYAHS